MIQQCYDLTIIGAGIISTALAYKLSHHSEMKIAVLEKEAFPNLHQTGRNSGVIHSGVYYPEGSSKSKNCISGYHQLIDFMEEFKIPFKITGKLIAATSENEFIELDRLYNNAIKLGLTVEKIEERDIKEIDNNLVAPKGFLVGETGITDYGVISHKFIELSRDKGVDFLFTHSIINVSNQNSVYKIHTSEKSFDTRMIVNCAGLQSDRVYSLCTGKQSPVSILPFKGEYFEVPSHNFTSDILVYPVPDPNFPFLGVHLTRMIDGSLKIGPNAVLSFSREGYNGRGINIKDAIDALCNTTIYNIAKKYPATTITELFRYGSKSFFEKNVNKYWSNFSKEDIIGYSCGIRAQATENGELLSDFRFDTIGKQLHVLNAPSPAATSCLSIADTIAQKIKTEFNEIF